MPTLNAKRDVRYHQYDINAIHAAWNVLHFMAEFDGGSELDFEAIARSLIDARDYIVSQRNGKPAAPKPETAK